MDALYLVEKNERNYTVHLTDFRFFFKIKIKCQNIRILFHRICINASFVDYCITLSNIVNQLSLFVDCLGKCTPDTYELNSQCKKTHL